MQAQSNIDVYFCAKALQINEGIEIAESRVTTYFICLEKHRLCSKNAAISSVLEEHEPMIWKVAVPLLHTAEAKLQTPTHTTSSPAPLFSGFGSRNSSNNLSGSGASNNPFGDNASSNPFGSSTYRNLFCTHDNTTKPSNNMSSFSFNSRPLYPLAPACQGTSNVTFAAAPDQENSHSVLYHHIVFMPECSKYSAEELRLADYSHGLAFPYGNRGDVGTNSLYSASRGLLGSPKKAGVGNAGARASSCASGSLFDNAASKVSNATSGAGFGSDAMANSLFAKTSATSGGLFDNVPSLSGGLFGNSGRPSGGLFENACGSKPLFSNSGIASAGLFDNTLGSSGELFGNSGRASSGLFGNASSLRGGLFGNSSSTHGGLSGPKQTGGSLFGNNKVNSNQTTPDIPKAAASFHFGKQNPNTTSSPSMVTNKEAGGSNTGNGGTNNTK